MTNITTTTGNVMTSGNLAEYIRREAIKQFEQERFFMDLMPTQQKPQGYNTYTFPKVDAMDWSVTNLQEWVTPDSSAFNLTNVTVTLIQKGWYATMSDILLTDAPVNTLDLASVEIWRQLANGVDAYIQWVIDAGTNVIYWGNATSRVTVDSTDVLTAVDLADVASLLASNSSPRFQGYYVAVMHPRVYNSILKETTTGAFIDVNKYAKPEQILKWEVGALYGVRVLVSANVQKFTWEWASSIDVYPTYVMGMDAYGVVTSWGLQVEYKPLGSGWTADPLNQRASAWAKMRVWAAILKEESLYRIETAVGI